MKMMVTVKFKVFDRDVRTGLKEIKINSCQASLP